MSIQEIANFLVEWEYNEDTYLDVTYAALSLFKKDKDCLYAYANSYSPFITHLLEVYEKRQEYSPDKYLIHAGNATVDCGLGYSKDYGIIKEELTVPTSVTEAISLIQQCLKLIRLKGVKYFQYPTEALNGLAEYYADSDVQKLLDCVKDTLVCPINAAKTYYIQKDEEVIENILNALDSLITVDPWDVRWERSKIKKLM